VWADDTPRHRLVDGVDIYIGVLPAEVMSKSTTDMHDAIPYEHSFHLVVALFDEKSGNRITDADIVASLSGKTEIETKTLDRMPIVNAPSYGNIFMLPGLGKFTIELKVSLPGSDEIISTDFGLSFLEANADGSLKVPAMIRDSLNERATYDYGIWTMMVVNTAVFIIFAFSFTRPKTGRDWRSFGAFSAFIIALFTEMYGFPLTIYLLSGWFASHYPDLNLYSHGAGHLWSSLIGFEGDPHADPLHILSNLFIFGGFFMLASAWRVLHKAQKNHLLANTGLYASVRHPQYDAFIIIMTGFLLQWPTILTLLMFPVLVWMYVRLARREEQESLHLFGDTYRYYMEKVPGFIPSLSRKGGEPWKA
jgi:protein-S-isoprenylcysteine O-methyltransferase Ste14